MNKTSVIFSILFSAAIGWSAQADFDRYQLIIERHPFGDEPPGDDMVQVLPSQSFARGMRLSMLFEGPDGKMRAGIIDSQSKKNYILTIGEIENGMELIEADMDTSEAQLRNGNEVARLKLANGTQQSPAHKVTNEAPKSYADRRRELLKKLEVQRKKEEPSTPKLTGEALRKHLESVQMDAIRTGKPPLPMPLTPEMDDQLVQEGFLPPQ